MDVVHQSVTYTNYDVTRNSLLFTDKDASKSYENKTSQSMQVFDQTNYKTVPRQKFVMQGIRTNYEFDSKTYDEDKFLHVKKSQKTKNPFACEECGYETSRKQHIQRHIKQVHTRIKDFECNQCNYVFSLKDSLNSHVKQVHSKIKDYKCNQCSYACYKKTTLDIYVKQVNSKIKDFECNQCSYACF